MMFNISTEDFLSHRWAGFTAVQHAKRRTFILYSHSDNPSKPCYRLENRS